MSPGAADHGRTMQTPVVSTPARGNSAPRPRLGRHFLLSEAGAAPGLVRYLSTAVELAEGAKTSWVTVTRTGSFTDPRYGRFEITPRMLAQMVANFDAGTAGQDVFIDVNHNPGAGAAAKVLRLAVEGTKLRALLEWTPYGIEAVRQRGFRYLSAEFNEAWRDNEKGDAHGCVLLGAGLTTRPVIKNLDTVQLSERTDGKADYRLAVHPNLIKSLESNVMNPIEQLRAKLLSQGLTEAQIKPLIDAFTTQLAAAGDDQAKQLSLVTTYETVGATLAAEVKRVGSPASITLSMPGLSAADVNAAVAKALSERDAAAAAEAATLAAKHKLLSDTIMADTALPEERRKLLAEEAQGMVNVQLSDDNVRAIGAMMLRHAAQASAAAQLATLGFRPASGSVHLSVESNEIKGLQAQIDKRLGFDRMPESQRFERTGGKLLEANKLLAEEALKKFDHDHGLQLMGEHKLLSGGVTGMGDISVPIVYERTVLREMLYQLVGTSLCDSGTYTFSNVVNIPYSYRDTTGASAADARTYEMQGIKRGGLIQTMDEARPIPQKLAYQISNETRYLLSASAMDFDAVAENTRNIIRMIAEDTDRLIHNELLNATDEAGVLAFNETLTAQVNGANGVFVLTAFPVVRPRRIYDLKGNQIGNTLNPLVVTLGGTARNEYQPGLGAGTYYVMDYNMGELRFVDQTGAPVIPNNGTALTVTGSRTTNAAKVDLYPGTATPTQAQTAAVYDALLLLIGGRKVVIENDRFYNANLLLMSGAVDNSLGQATTFQANSSRPGTGLNPDGSVGVVKGIPAFNTKAPALNQGDVRVLVGERANTRFRMIKPFSMQPQPDQSKNANGLFIGAQENYGDQYIAVHTPTMRKNAMTSLVLFNSVARVPRVS